MKAFMKSISCFVLAAFSASAMDTEYVNKLVDSAKSIEKEASVIAGALKSKKYDGKDVKAKIDAMETHISGLRDLVTHVESANTSMTAGDKQVWDRVKTKVQLLEIFHNQKKKLAEEDLDRNRSIIRIHADGVAKRAQLLQQAATKLQKVPLT